MVIFLHCPGTLVLRPEAWRHAFLFSDPVIATQLHNAVEQLHQANLPVAYDWLWLERGPALRRVVRCLTLVDDGTRPALR